ncbi:hypothetical protein LWI29_029450 [Acer saccharum]|uniref:Uncharacterized protein n=1 Tax=Acer saccharum TaxID=4024 RepID=A0AA39VCG9_ACESA|nr:hypothetical protein LWI29_029450 [Acer saccharum]
MGIDQGSIHSNNQLITGNYSHNNVLKWTLQFRSIKDQQTLTSEISCGTFWYMFACMDQQILGARSAMGILALFLQVHTRERCDENSSGADFAGDFASVDQRTLGSKSLEFPRTDFMGGFTESNFGGKNFGITAYSGKAGNGLKSGGGSSSHGANMIGKGTDSRKMVDKAHVALTGRRVVQTSKNGNSCNISSGGSRFAILFEEGAEERFAKKALSPSLERGKGVSNSVLSEISNLVPSRKKYLPPLPNKYLLATG